MTKDFARTFGTNASVGGGGMCDQAVSHPAVPGRGTSGLAPSSAYTPAAHRAGTFQGGAPDTVRDAGFYARKRAAEEEAGRPLSIEEFRSVSGDVVEGTSSGTSIFDPVLCELAYQWFCPPGGLVLDPFAGGSVRGIVASHMGRRYVGVELRAEQVAANRAQAHVGGPTAPQWHTGDSRHIRELCRGVKADFLFTCPPYGDLERYSDDPADISTLGYPEFLAAYTHIIAESTALLKPNRFACFVVGDYRDKRGLYRAFPAKTIAAFEAAGLALYNDAVLITAVGSLPVRAGRQFRTGRKLGKTHQNILVFVKGDPRKAAEACEAKGAERQPSLLDEVA